VSQPRESKHASAVLRRSSVRNGLLKKMPIAVVQKKFFETRERRKEIFV
jgi:hypothetical protein